jgi:hypothetical protein
MRTNSTALATAISAVWEKSVAAAIFRKATMESSVYSLTPVYSTKRVEHPSKIEVNAREI